MRSQVVYISLFCLFTLHTFGQSEKIKLTNKDAEVWSSVNVDANFTKKIRSSISQELRINDNISSFKSTFTDIGIMYKVNKYLRVGGNYRFAIRSDVTRHRFYGNVTFRYRIQQFRLSYRVRLQKEFEREQIAETYLRNKLRVLFNTKKAIDPFIGTEFYYHIFHYRGSQFDKFRIRAGIDWSLNKKSSINLFYLYQKEIYVVDPLQNYIIGVGYNYVLK